MAFRIALAANLAPGRDELAYWYWAWHGLEAGYSPVTVLPLRLSTMLFGDGALAMRLPSMLAAIAAAGVVLRLARRAGASARGAAWAAAAFVATPWQTWVGAVVHPDAWFTLFVLLLAERAAAAESARDGGRAAGPALVGAAAAAGLAALTKLTGAILLPAPLLLAWRHRRAAPAGAGAAAAVVAGAAALLLATLDPGILEGMREFGRFAPDTGAIARAAILLGEIALFGGPALLIAAARGAGRPHAPGARPAALVAAILLSFHVAFALLGQAKANWFLPAATLLLPAGLAAGRPPRAAVAASAALAVAGGVLAVRLAGGAALPAPLARLDAAYALHLGTRETAVSPSRTWSDRGAEYATASLPPRPAGGGKPPRILSEDYGLAFAVARHWGRDAEALLPGDPVYRSTCGRPPAPGEDLVFVSRAAARPPLLPGGRFASVRPRPLPSANDPALSVLDCLGWSPGGLPSPSSAPGPGPEEPR